MVSEYLQRQLRDRLMIAADLSRNNDSSCETMSAISDGLDVMFAVTGYTRESDRPVFLHVSSYAHTLTGYWPNELKGVDPAILQCENTNMVEAHRLMEDISRDGHGEARLINRRKNGDEYGCHLFAYKCHQSESETTARYHAFLVECSTKACP